MKNRRKQYFVKGGEHRGLLIGVFFLVLTIVIIASGLFYIMASRNLENATYRAHFQESQNTMDLLLPWLILVNMVGLIVVFIMAVFMTHRVSGPAYHLVKDLKSIQDGDLTVTTTFRKKDRLKNVAEALSQATSEIRRNISVAKEGLSELESKADKYPELERQIQKIKQALDRLKT